MILRSIEYNNFRPFKGTQKMDLSLFSNDNNKNVIIILGDNTFGKSTFVLSFIWCLYGESKFDQPNSILNKKVERDLKVNQREKASVEVVFEDDNKVYTMKRTQYFVKKLDGSLSTSGSEALLTYVTEYGETKSTGNSYSEINRIIQSILPKDLSSFFFFEGEKDNDMSNKDLKNSVSTLIGLSAFENMRKHLFGNVIGTTPSVNSVMGYYQEKQNDESDFRAKAEFEKIKKLEAELKIVQNNIGDCKNNIEKYEDKIDEIKDLLRMMEPTKKLQKQRDSLGESLKYLSEELNVKYRDFREYFSKNSLPMFLYPTMSKTKKRLQDMDVADKGIRGLDVAAIHELLHRGKCLCGNDLKEGSIAYEAVKKYIDYIPPRSVGTLVRGVLESIDSNGDKAKDFVTSFESKYQEIQKTKNQIEKVQREFESVSIEISKVGDMDASSLENNLKEYQSKLQDLKMNLDRYNSSVGRITASITNANTNFNMYKSKSQAVKKYQMYYKYAEKLYQSVNKNYTIEESNLRNNLVKYVTEIFNNIYSGNRKISLDNKYNIKVISNEGNIAVTGGLRVISYFSFVGGLVKLAYKVMQERDKAKDGMKKVLGEQYPLVLDAAFSHADEIHTKNIAKELSCSANQLIFAIMRKDWNYAKDGLIGKVGRTYELKKIDESEVEILEVL